MSWDCRPGAQSTSLFLCMAQAAPTEAVLLLKTLLEMFSAASGAPVSAQEFLDHSFRFD